MAVFTSGDGQLHNSSSGTLTQIVNRASSAVSLNSGLNPSDFGNSVTFTATVTGSGGTPTGTVQFLDGSNIIATVSVSSGTATYAISTLSVATHNIKAIYMGDDTYTGSTSNLLSQVVNSSGTVPDCHLIGQPVRVRSGCDV